MSQSLSYVYPLCKSYRSSKFYLVDIPTPIWELSPPHFSTQNHKLCHAPIGFGPNNFQMRRNFSKVDEEDWIIIDLKICKIRSISRNQLQKLNLHSNAHNSANKTWNQTIGRPPKEVKYVDQSNLINILSSKCSKPYSTTWFRI